MKIFLLTLTIIHVLFNDSSAFRHDNTFILGYLFHDHSYDLTIAFKYAVVRHNLYRSDIHFKTVMHRVSETDLYDASKTVCNMISHPNGITAVFGPESPYTIPMVQSVCSNLELAHIQTSWRPTTQKSETVLNFYPDTDLIAKALSTMIRYMEWKNFVILYQHNEGLLRLQEILKSTRDGDVTIMVRQLDPSRDFRELLKFIKQSFITQLIIDCELDLIIPILEQAKEIGFLDFGFSYLFTSLDAHTLDFSVLDTSANITTMRIFDPDNPMLYNAVRDWETGELNDNRSFRIDRYKVRTEVALMHDAVKFFMNAVAELNTTEPVQTEQLFCNETFKKSGGHRVVNFMKIKRELDAITGPIKFNSDGVRIDFKLQLVEIIRDSMTIVATWTPDEPDSLHLLRNASQHAQQVIENLQKTLVIVSSRLGSPYLMKREPKYPGEILEGNARYEGYSLDLIEEISKQLNFTYKFALTKDGKYGNYDESTKSWNGLIKDLLDRKAHLAICDLTITHKRREVVDFSMPFMTLGISILYRKSKEEERSIFAFMDPLETEVWLYIGTAYISVTIVIYLIARMAPGDWENPHPCDQNPEELENIWTLKNCLWLLLGSTMSQGCDILPKGISSRMAISMWWFLILIINSSYTANLAAFLTRDRMGPMIDSAEALAKQTKIKYGVLKDGSTMQFFKESNYTTYKRMWQQMQTAKPSVFEKNNADGVKRVLTTKNNLYAFLMESSSIEYEVERNCELRQVGSRLDSKGYGIAMPVDAPYRGAINQAVLKLQQEGKLNILKDKWWKEMHGGGACDEVVEEKNADELGLDNVGGVFLVLGVGVGMSFGFAVLEFLWNVRQVSVEEHISYWAAFVIEIKFALNVTVTKKRVKPQISEKSSTSSEDGFETQSIAQRLKAAGSFLNLEVFDKISMNKKL